MGEHVHGNGTSLVAHLELEQRSDLLQCRFIRRLAASICHALAVMFHHLAAFVHERAKGAGQGDNNVRGSTQI
jgi:hypothetical protein